MRVDAMYEAAPGMPVPLRRFVWGMGVVFAVLLGCALWFVYALQSARSEVAEVRRDQETAIVPTPRVELPLQFDECSVPDYRIGLVQVTPGHEPDPVLVWYVDCGRKRLVLVPKVDAR